MDMPKIDRAFKHYQKQAEKTVSDGVNYCFKQGSDLLEQGLKSAEPLFEVAQTQALAVVEGFKGNSGKKRAAKTESSVSEPTPPTMNLKSAVGGLMSTSIACGRIMRDTGLAILQPIFQKTEAGANVAKELLHKSAPSVVEPLLSSLQIDMNALFLLDFLSLGGVVGLIFGLGKVKALGALWVGCMLLSFVA